jgi:peptidoglycan hydrolase-like protein with peptidoglycan-binding domain
MPIVAGTFTPVLSPVGPVAGGGGTAVTPTPAASVLPVAIIKQLQSELAAVGLSVTGSEVGATPVFSAATSAQLRTFQTRYSLPVTGNLDSATGGILTLAALVASEGDRSKVQAGLQSSLNKVADSPEYNYWLARYAVVTHDYATAYTAAQAAADFPLVKSVIGPIISPPSPRPPDAPYPENFYSYKYNPFSQDMLDQLKAQLEAMTPAVPAGVAWVEAIRQWQLGNQAFEVQEYAAAAAAYDSCQQSALDYFAAAYGIAPVGGTVNEKLTSLLIIISNPSTTSPANWSSVWNAFQWRRNLLSLTELQQNDWNRMANFPTQGGVFYDQFLNGMVSGSAKRRNDVLDVSVLTIACVLVPLARSEANRMRRFFDGALSDLTWVMNPYASRILLQNIVTTSAVATLDPAVRPNTPPVQPSQTIVVDPPVWPLPAQLTCEFIELPFGKLQFAETLLDKADAEYKAQTAADPASFPQAAQYQNLQAAQTYLAVPQVFANDGQYTARAQQAGDAIAPAIQAALAQGISSQAFRTVGMNITVPTITAATAALPGLDRRVGPHAPILKFQVPSGQQVLRETNPHVYSILLTAQAKLKQIAAKLNYLGYSDDYVPPWRFSFLLDQARYFTDHAKNAQRDYLNFLNNAQNEEYKEMSASQNVELENSNVQIETARVEQAALQVQAAQQSAALAQLTAQDAVRRALAYASFDKQADDLAGTGLITAGPGALPGLVGGTAGTLISNVLGIAADVGDFFSGGAVSKELDRRIASLQRQYELYSLKLSAQEAQQAATVAQAQLAVAQAGLEVESLTRQAALLRHEYALQNLDYLRNQTLNTEQWYRLANAIRGVSDTYLHYAIQLAFLAQRAYEFESDRRMNVIRFDYDLSTVGSMLAADFLARDLDRIEQDLLVSQQTRQQQVRYVVSLARDYPDALQALARTGQVTFSVRLEQFERHFPGLFNLRISSVDLLPVALMDPTRVTMQLTQTGTGMVRLKAQPDTGPGILSTSPLNTNDISAPGDDWLSNLRTDWPVKVHVSGSETDVYSGLTQQNAATLSMINANERGAFEDLPGASSWRIDMSGSENRIVPGTLADVVITFTLSGFFDSSLRDAIAQAPPRMLASTRFISARRTLPDALYSLVQQGSLGWDVSEDMLVLNGTPGALRNVAVVLPLVQDGLELGRCYCRYPIQIQVAAAAVSIQTILPQFTVSQTGLTINCSFTGPAAVQAAWDFGDNSTVAQGATVIHAYGRPGRYTLLARFSQNGSLVEYRTAIVVSANNAVTPPLIAAPTMSAGALSTTDGTVPVTISLPAGMTDVSLDCSAAATRGYADNGQVVLNLKPGTYLLDFLAMRKFSARFYSKQRYFPAAAVSLYRGRVSTNRTFDPVTNANTTTSPNVLTTQIFGDGTVSISPVDRWTLELPLAENLWFTTVSASDIASFDGSELDDAVISLEYPVLQEG